MWLRSVDASHSLDPSFGVSDFTLSGEWSGLLPSGYSTQWTHHILWTPRLVCLTLHYLGSGQHPLPSGYSAQWTHHILWTPRLVFLTLHDLGSGQASCPVAIPPSGRITFSGPLVWCVWLYTIWGVVSTLCPVAILPSGRITFSGPLVWCLLTSHYLGSDQALCPVAIHCGVATVSGRMQTAFSLRHDLLYGLRGGLFTNTYLIPMLAQWWSTVVDGRPSLNQHWDIESGWETHTLVQHLPKIT